MAQQEKLLNSIVTAISDSLDLDDLLQRAVDQMLQVFHASRSLAVLCRPTDVALMHTAAAADPGFDDLRGVAIPIVSNPHAQAVLSQDCPVAIIETPEQMQYLQAHQCHSGQGYLFAPPLTPSDVPAFLAQSLADLTPGPSPPRRREREPIQVPPLPWERDLG